MTEEQLNQERAKIAEELRARRRHLKLTQRELAEQVGMQEATISKIENGAFWPNMKQYVLLLNALRLERLEPLWLPESYLPQLQKRYQKNIK